MTVLTMYMCGNESCLRDICYKLDPDYNFPINPFDGLRFGEMPSEYDRGCTLELGLKLIDNNLIIAGHKVEYMKNGAPCATMVQGEGSPGLER